MHTYIYIYTLMYIHFVHIYTYIYVFQMYALENFFSVYRSVSAVMPASESSCKRLRECKFAG